MPRPEEELVTVFHAYTEFEGITIRDLLLHHGLPCMLRGARDVSGYFNITWGSLFYRGEVQVFARDVEKAEELIAGFQGTLGMLEETELPDEVE